MAYVVSNGHVTDDVTWPQWCCEAVRLAILATAWLLVHTGDLHSPAAGLRPLNLATRPIGVKRCTTGVHPTRHNKDAAFVPEAEHVTSYSGVSVVEVTTTHCSPFTAIQDFQTPLKRITTGNQYNEHCSNIQYIHNRDHNHRSVCLHCTNDHQLTSESKSYDPRTRMYRIQMGLNFEDDFTSAYVCEIM